MNAIDVQNLNIDFGRFKIDDVSFSVRNGGITGLIGANGAGKTTLIKAIMRSVNAQSGSILYYGKKFKGNEREILSSVTCVFDDLIFAPTVKPNKFVKLYGQIYPKFDMNKYNELAERFKLPQDIRVNKYSLGMKKKLNFILALCIGADTLILDEPTANIDPFDRNELMTLLQEYMIDENHSVLFSTHLTDELDKIADYIVMIDDGKMLLDSDKESLAEKYRIVRAQTLTQEMESSAIGLTKDMFGYTFLTDELSIAALDGVQAKPPTLEELFVHLIKQRKSSKDMHDSNDIFGV